jgi:alpha-tubulin suppressor-like RCC1 family protein
MGGLEKDIDDVALGDAHGCALHKDAGILCWGSNAYGQLAQPALEEPMVDPKRVPDVAGVTRLAVGQNHTCAIVGLPGEVHCWGRNGNAQVGNGSTSDAVPVPSRVAGIDDAMGIAAGGSHTCALREGGSVVCWGYNYFGQLGNDSTKPTRATSIQNVVHLEDAVQVTAGQHFTCALRNTGAVVCWGHNGHGQLGDGTTEDRTSPVAVSIVENVAMVSAGDLHACAASRDGRLWCWGYNLGGQLGTGEVDDDPVPTPVLVEQLPP